MMHGGVIAGGGRTRRPSLQLASVAPAFIDMAPPGGTNGVAYGSSGTGYQFTVSGSPASTFTVTAGAIPTGLTLSSSGLLSGTPSSTATFNFTIQADNGVGTASTGSLQVIITASGVPAAPADVSTGPAATDIITYWNFDATSFTDAQLIDLRDNWGIKGFGLFFGYSNLGLTNYAGDADWTTDTTATFNSADGRINTANTYDRWSYARALKYGNDGNTVTPTTGNGNFITRCHALGMEVYLGTYMQVPGRLTPLAHWWDDTAWTNICGSNSGFITLVQHVNAWGIDGILLDDECFPVGGTEPTWSWNYGHPNTEAATRSKVRDRGIQMAQAFAAIKPNLKILEYNTTGHAGWPDDWDEDIVQNAAGRGVSIKAPKVELDFWRGFLSEPTFTGSLNTWSATFYRNTGVTATWFGAIQYDIVNVMAKYSRYTGSDWSQIAAKFKRHPFFWPGHAADPFGGEDNPVTVQTCTDQFAAGRQISMGQMGYYIQTGGPPSGFDSIYKAAIKAGGTPGTVNSSAPTFSSGPTSSGRAGNEINISGTAAHAYGIWRIDYHVYNSGGTAVESQGCLGHDFVPGSNNYTAAAGYSDATYTFSGTITAPASRYVRITAVTVKGQSHAVVIQV